MKIKLQTCVKGGGNIRGLSGTLQKRLRSNNIGQKKVLAVLKLYNKL